MVNLYRIQLVPEMQEIVDQMMNNEEARFTRAVELLERNGTTLKEPHVKKVRGKIWELRYRWSKLNIRVFYFSPERGLFVLLHMITKKTSKTPSKDIAVAEWRMRAYQERAGKQAKGREMNRFPIPVHPNIVSR